MGFARRRVALAPRQKVLLYKDVARRAAAIRQNVTHRLIDAAVRPDASLFRPTGFYRAHVAKTPTEGSRN